jgi:hypothetical protein
LPRLQGRRAAGRPAENRRSDHAERQQRPLDRPARTSADREPFGAVAVPAITRHIVVQRGPRGTCNGEVHGLLLSHEPQGSTASPSPPTSQSRRAAETSPSQAEPFAFAHALAHPDPQAVALTHPTTLTITIPHPHSTAEPDAAITGFLSAAHRVAFRHARGRATYSRADRTPRPPAGRRRARRGIDGGSIGG